MGKIAPISAKYIIHAKIFVKGVVEKPDVIGAIFGQTEGLLGEELELRELQKSGRIGRIEVELDTRAGKTEGHIIIPSSLDKAETAIVAAAIETIQRIGPCDAKVTVEKIEDVRVTKRDYVLNRAKELLKSMVEEAPDSKELADEVKKSLRAMELIEYGPERLPAGAGIYDSDEIIIVEGRADVIHLLRNGFRNVIALNGTSVPESIIDLCHKKTATVFVDGDRGGDLIIRELLNTTEIDFVARAPPGKEVEELTKKEIHKCLRAKVPVEQVKEEGSEFKTLLEEVMGSKGAYLLGEKKEILGKVPIKDLESTLKELDNVSTIIMDGTVTPKIVQIAEKAGVSYIVAPESRARSRKVKIITKRNLR